MQKPRLPSDEKPKFVRTKEAGHADEKGRPALQEPVKLYRVGFTAKIFVFVISFIVLISAAFTVFFIREQNKAMEEGLINEGYSHLRLFANSSRLGVISENGSFIEGTLDGLLKNGEIVEASVFTLQGKVLIARRRQAEKTQITTENRDRSTLIDRIKKTKELLHFKKGNAIDFWGPVLMKSATSEASLFYNELGPTQEQVVGFVNIILDTSQLQAKLQAILVRGVVTSLFFLLIGSFIAYIVARKVARPLNRLTAAVKSVSSGGFAADVSVETTDEIGRLAQSFNEMIAALKKREYENIQLEAQLRQSQKMEAVGQLAGGVAHEINNPVNSITNFAQLILDEGGLEKNERSYAERIISECDRISNIVRGLLAFSRDSVDQKRPISIKDIISDTLDLTAAQLRKDGTNLIVLTSEDLPEITANPFQIVQVFLNVISNARYALNQRYPAGHENKVLKISSDEASIDHKTYIRIVFRDHGTGIPADVLEKVTNPFFTTKPAGYGTGLGLSISYGIIHEHGGRFEISSTKGEHTTVVIHLPAGGRSETQDIAGRR